MAKYLTLSGLQTFYAGLKTKLDTKVEKVEGKALSTNDLTDELKQQYDAAYQYASTTDAEKNVVVGVQVNGADLDVDGNRKVNVVVPTKTSDITNDSDYTTQALLDAAVEALEGKIATAEGEFDDYYNKTEVDGYVSNLQEAIAAAAAGKITTLVVDSIDVSAKTYTIDGSAKPAEVNVIYLVPKNPGQTNNVKDEYMLIGGSFEKIGDTEIDLSAYAKTEDVTSAISVAQAAAESTAAQDATQKATAAETTAKEYADDLNTAMDERVAAVEASTASIIAITDEEINKILNGETV